jgi:ABC-type antimicrobial peptide transport system permease subunit
MALGAQRSDVLQMVLSEGAKMALVGVVAGVAIPLGLTRLMSRVLYGVTEQDPLTFASVAILLSVVALAACYIPARRAVRVDPMMALRHEQSEQCFTEGRCAPSRTFPANSPGTP